MDVSSGAGAGCGDPARHLWLLPRLLCCGLQRFKTRVLRIGGGSATWPLSVDRGFPRLRWRCTLPLPFLLVITSEVRLPLSSVCYSSTVRTVARPWIQEPALNLSNAGALYQGDLAARASAEPSTEARQARQILSEGFWGSLGSLLAVRSS